MNYLTVAGKHLEVAWYGASADDRPTLVFLHEGLGCVGMWKDFPARLSARTGCPAFAYSRLGYGGSDPCTLPRTVSYMHEEALEMLPFILEVAGIRQCILIGHSDGGSIALIYAGGTPAESLRGIITESAHVFCEEISVRSIQQAKVDFIYGELRKKLHKYHGPNTDCAFWAWNCPWLHPDFLYWNIEEYLSQIRVPLLAVQGEDDHYGTVRQLEAIADQAGDRAEIQLLPSCGHAPHEDCTEMVLDLMSRFISRILSP